MRAAPGVLLVFSIAGFSSPALTQSPNIEFQAGLGYARVFGGGGISFAAAVERPLSPGSGLLQHALGGSLWYAHTSIASFPDDPEGRHITGLGLRYQLELGRCCRSFRPFLAVPVQLLRSSIPDRAQLQGTDLLISRIPQPDPSPPVEDLVGSDWGWGAGLEIGIRLGLAQQLGAQTSVQGLYQDIYASGTRHGAWTWHAGLTYRIGFVAQQPSRLFHRGLLRAPIPSHPAGRAAQVLAQSRPASYPDLLADWQRNRTTVLAYIDAMPGSATGFGPTPGVRTFAEQFDHILGANLETAAVALRGLKAAPTLGDSAVYLHDKAALRRHKMPF